MSPSVWSDADLEELRQALGQLRRTTASLRILGAASFLLTCTNLLPAALLPFLRFDVRPFVLGVAIGLTFVALLAVAAYERARRRGNIAFEEISETLEWGIRPTREDARRSSSPGGGSRSERPLLLARIELRTFSTASDLPLIPGRLGPAVYAGVNIVLYALAVLVRSA